MTDKSWSVREAKARFSEILDASLEKGPQVITRRGDAIAVLVRFEQWQALKERAGPSLKDLLLANEPRIEALVPPRNGRWLRRGPSLG